jgi:hypothetical protein
VSTATGLAGLQRTYFASSIREGNVGRMSDELSIGAVEPDRHHLCGVTVKL